MRAILGLLLVAGCMARPVAVDSPPARTTGASTATLASDVVISANRARASQGRRGLEARGELNAAAADFARELAARRTLSHTSSRAGYTTLMERLDRAGARVNRAGENVAMMSARSEMADAVVRMWLDSPGHRRNLLSEAYTITGAGAARASDGAWYFVQVYAAPAGSVRR